MTAEGKQSAQVHVLATPLGDDNNTDARTLLPRAGQCIVLLQRAEDNSVRATLRAHGQPSASFAVGDDFVACALSVAAAELQNHIAMPKVPQRPATLTGDLQFVRRTLQSVAGTSFVSSSNARHAQLLTAAIDCLGERRFGDHWRARGYTCLELGFSEVSELLPWRDLEFHQHDALLMVHCLVWSKSAFQVYERLVRSERPISSFFTNALMVYAGLKSLFIGAMLPHFSVVVPDGVPEVLLPEERMLAPFFVHCWALAEAVFAEAHSAQINLLKACWATVAHMPEPIEQDAVDLLTGQNEESESHSVTDK